MNRYSVNLEYIRFKRKNTPKMSKKETENYYRAILSKQNNQEKGDAII